MSDATADTLVGTKIIPTHAQRQNGWPDFLLITGSALSTEEGFQVRLSLDGVGCSPRLLAGQLYARLLANSQAFTTFAHVAVNGSDVTVTLARPPSALGEDEAVMAVLGIASGEMSCALNMKVYRVLEGQWTVIANREDYQNSKVEEVSFWLPGKLIPDNWESLRRFLQLALDAYEDGLDIGMMAVGSDWRIDVLFVSNKAKRDKEQIASDILTLLGVKLRMPKTGARIVCQPAPSPKP